MESFVAFFLMIASIISSGSVSENGTFQCFRDETVQNTEKIEMFEKERTGGLTADFSYVCTFNQKLYFVIVYINQEKGRVFR